MVKQSYSPHGVEGAEITGDPDRTGKRHSLQDYSLFYRGFTSELAGSKAGLHGRQATQRKNISWRAENRGTVK